MYTAFYLDLGDQERAAYNDEVRQRPAQNIKVGELMLWQDYEDKIWYYRVGSYCPRVPGALAGRSWSRVRIIKNSSPNLVAYSGYYRLSNRRWATVEDVIAGEATIAQMIVVEAPKLASANRLFGKIMRREVRPTSGWGHITI